MISGTQPSTTRKNTISASNAGSALGWVIIPLIVVVILAIVATLVFANMDIDPTSRAADGTPLKFKPLEPSFFGPALTIFSLSFGLFALLSSRSKAIYNPHTVLEMMGPRIIWVYGIYFTPLIAQLFFGLGIFPLQDMWRVRAMAITLFVQIAALLGVHYYFYSKKRIDQNTHKMLWNMRRRECPAKCRRIGNCCGCRCDMLGEQKDAEKRERPFETRFEKICEHYAGLANTIADLPLSAVTKAAKGFGEYLVYSLCRQIDICSLAKDNNNLLSTEAFLQFFVMGYACVPHTWTKQEEQCAGLTAVQEVLFRMLEAEYYSAIKPLKARVCLACMAGVVAAGMVWENPIGNGRQGNPQGTANNTFAHEFFYRQNIQKLSTVLKLSAERNYAGNIGKQISEVYGTLRTLMLDRYDDIYPGHENPKPTHELFPFEELMTGRMPAGVVIDKFQWGRLNDWEAMTFNDTDELRQVVRKLYFRDQVEQCGDDTPDGDAIQTMAQELAVELLRCFCSPQPITDDSETGRSQNA